MKLHLPKGLNIIADVAGEEAAITLAVALGGGEIDVPKQPAGSRLEALVGAAAAAALSAAYGGSRLEIPVARRSVAYWLFARGASVAEVKRDLRMTRRAVQNFKAEFDAMRGEDMPAADLPQLALPL